LDRARTLQEHQRQNEQVQPAEYLWKVENRHWSKAEVKAMAALAQRPLGKLQPEVLVEGPKMISEALLSGWIPTKLVLDSKHMEGPEGDQPALFQSLKPFLDCIGWASTTEMGRISRLNSPPAVLGFFRQPPVKERKNNLPPWWLVLDRIQDPGNLGTLLRNADWFGFCGLICSPDTVDCYNSKVMQASMGSVFRIPVHYTPLTQENLSRITGFSEQIFGAPLSGNHELGASTGPWVVGADTRGVSMENVAFPKEGGLLLVGNESKGLSDQAKALCRYFWAIPSYGNAESLNAAVAAGVCCYGIRLRTEPA
jgi:TrmH family RNA methyltransferase